jgi:protein TonB
MAFGTATPIGGGRAVAANTGATEGGDVAQTYPENGVSSQARLLEGTPPEYPPAARAAAVEADLPLEIVVDASGAVIDARLLRHAGYGLDEAALRAIRAYRFAPAQRAGHGVSVRMRWVVDFRLD